MLDFVKHILAAYTLWFVLAEAELPVWRCARAWLMDKSETAARFFLCPMCAGFWCSLFLSAAVTIGDGVVSAPVIIACLVKAFAGTAGVFLIETHVRRLQER